MLVLDDRELAMTELEKIKSCLQEELEPIVSNVIVLIHNFH